MELNEAQRNGVSLCKGAYGLLQLAGVLQASEGHADSEGVQSFTLVVYAPLPNLQEPCFTYLGYGNKNTGSMWLQDAPTAESSFRSAMRLHPIFVDETNYE